VIQTTNGPGVQNDPSLPVIQFAPGKIHHGYISEMERQNSLTSRQLGPEVSNLRLFVFHVVCT
jgi:hypothetical protein